MAAKKKAATGKPVKAKKTVDVVAKRRGPSKKKLRIVKRGIKLKATKKDKGCLPIPKVYKPRNGSFVVVKGTKGIAGILHSVVGDLCNVIVGGSPEIEIVPLKSVRRATRDEERIIRFFMDRAGEAQPEEAEEAPKADDLSVLYAAYAQSPKSQQVVETAEGGEG